eukprot:TRINITY_DN3732_c0_g1_i1.p1 TRINITY_DN3732_c0_g1~~TRINITY_DN3732_c0_g1_i1.p1  ORF type:complete len:203 (+),score=66.19 TRINITY_DN3732_c0_g1_i1:97-705(+)
MAARHHFEQTLLQHLNAGEYQKAIHACESYEIEAAAAQASVVPFYDIHLLSLLIVNDLTNAKFLWKRVPKEVKAATPELASLWAIGKNMWTRNYPEVFVSLNNPNWSAHLVPLIAKLSETFRARTLTLLSKAYSSLSVSDSASYLGLNNEDTIKYVTQHGWLHDAATHTLTPKLSSSSSPQTIDPNQLQQLTEYVVFLERRL